MKAMNHTFTAIALDDNKAALHDLEYTLAAHVPEIRLLRKCTHRRQVKACLAAHGPADFFFCDIRLGTDNGLKVAADLMDDFSMLLFFTDYGDHKDAALDLGADAYLKKPVDPKEVKQRVRKLEKIRRRGGMIHDLERRLFFRDVPGKKSVCLPVSAITAITTHTEKNHLQLMTDKERFVTRKSLKKMMDELRADPLFVQIGQGTYVALSAIHQLQKGVVYLHNGYFFPVGRAYHAGLVKRIKER